jgi:hypothetical protein
VQKKTTNKKKKNNEKKYIVTKSRHSQTTPIIGSVPPDKLREFFSANFVPKAGGTGIRPVELWECMGCPQSARGHKLTSCAMVIHNDGGCQIQCNYK